MNEEDKILNLAKMVGKTVAKQLFKRLILPYLPVVGLVCAVLFLMLMFVGAIYSAVPQTGTVTGDVNSPQSKQDKEIIAADKKIANKYNIANTWLVSDQSDVEPPSGGWYDKLVGCNMNSLCDHYGNDKQQIYTWGFVNALETFYAVEKGIQVNTTDTEMLANILKPYFYYKKSEIITTTCDKDG